MNSLNILIVEDHLLMIEAYKSILSYHADSNAFNFIEAVNCEAAFHIIAGDRIDKILIDIVILDLNLPKYTAACIEGGADLIFYIKKFLPNCKIVVVTSHSETIKIYDILKLYDPAGFLIKSEFTGDDFLLAFDLILNGGNYISPLIKKSIESMLSEKVYLDSYNRQILILLGQGIRTKNLINYLPISMSAIEKRKSIIKDFFNIIGNDEDLIQEARRRKFI